MYSKRLLLFLSLSIFSFQLSAQQVNNARVQKSINSHWEFRRGAREEAKDVQWDVVSFPHTWNATDALDEEPGYYRGEGWYKKTLFISPIWKDKEVFLYFQGANQEVDVFINGQKAGSHVGGYTGFAVPVSSFLDFKDEEELAIDVEIKVNNRHNEDIPPLSADFTFFGGIYRDVYLVAMNKVHFSFEAYAASGVQLSTPQINENKADVGLKSHIKNGNKKVSKIKVSQQVLDADKILIKQVSKNVSVKPGETIEVEQLIENLQNPHLWSPEDPYLYEVVTQIKDSKTGEILDEVSNPLGFRWFEFDADKGFFMNGKHIKLIGTNRHQDFKDIGNALPDVLHINDIKLLKKMGGNFLRIAHYPQDPAILQMCDKLGIITSVEIPIVNRVTESEAFMANCQHMMREMIHQNFNHPSVVIWAYMNEVLIDPRYEANTLQRANYYKEVARQAQALEDIIRAEDPSRYTMIPNHGWFEGYNDVGLTKIPMIVGWNLYQGWYGADIHGFEAFLEKHHRLLPDKPLIVTEYGAGADPRLHSFSPKRFDFTVEYQTYYHKHYIDEIRNHPFVAGANAWNLNDFYSEGRRDAVPHINNKGLVSQNRVPKDAYYYYQAALLKEPFIAIGAKLWKNRTGTEEADGAGYCYQSLEVYSNLKDVNLKVNGKELDPQEVKNFTTTWNIPFKNGKNSIEAYAEKDGQALKDFLMVNFELQPFTLTSKTTPFESIKISLGSHRYFVDDITHEVWQPDQVYKRGQWGVVGSLDSLKTTASDILGTQKDPIYQTQQDGIKAYQLDVPVGRYEVIFHFAELLSEKELDKLVYNLGQEQHQEKSGKRIFDVLINGEMFIDSLNLAEQYGEKQAVSFKTEVLIQNDQGINISFNASAGQAVLNGLEVRKIY